MSRKNLSDVQAQDLLLKWKYEGVDGRHDMYDVYAVQDYRVGATPMGQLAYNPRSGSAWTELRSDLFGKRLQARGSKGEKK